MFCAYCKKRRHAKDNCWKLAWKNQNAGKKAYATSSSSQNPVASSEVEEVQKKLSSIALVKSGTNFPHDWVADTGATDHMSPTGALFTQYSPNEEGHKVQTAGGGMLSVRGVGEISLRPIGVLKDVLHVESLQTNLISIQKLVDAHGWRFILDSDDCFLCDKVTGKRTLSFRREGGLLLLDGSPMQCLASQRVCSKEERVIRLHRRMGHPPFDLLRCFYPSLCRGISDKNLFCNACHLEKLKRSSYKSMDDRCILPFDCIHSDVWGPCPVESLTGCRYFLIFVDDCTRTMWLHLLQSKAEVPQVTVQLCRMIVNQFGMKIKRFRSDNGTEFVNCEMKSFFGENGILHETSCVSTPQQNGLAERRMGYVLATTRSLLFQGNMPKRYWGEAVLTAAHLINRIPMKVIEYDSPLGLLTKFFPKVRLFMGLPARVFGCVAFIHQNTGKLDPRGLRCIFIGYYGSQKGYRCYHPPSRKFFVSADIVFNESENYYATENLPKDVPEETEQTGLDFLRYLGGISLGSQIPPQSSSTEEIQSIRVTETDENKLEAVQQSSQLPVEVNEEHEAANNSQQNVTVEEIQGISSSEIQKETDDDDLGWPIALRKGVRTCRTNVKYPISHYVKYEKLGRNYRGFLTLLGNITIPSRIEDALRDPGWKAAMDEEMMALEKNNT